MKLGMRVDVHLCVPGSQTGLGPQEVLTCNSHPLLTEVKALETHRMSRMPFSVEWLFKYSGVVSMTSFKSSQCQKASGESPGLALEITLKWYKCTDEAE